MFEYNICMNANNEEFTNACEKIEENIDNIIKGETIIDVDGSIVQIYTKDGYTIKIYNDYEIDAVYIDSEIDLDNIF